MDITDKIIKLIDDLRPFLVSDGGDIQFVKFEEGIVYVRMLGACSNCAMVDFTIKDGVEAILVNEIPEVKQVIQIQDQL